MKFTDEQLGQLPSTFYRVTAKALVFDDEGRLLVGRNEQGGYEIPGGGWEFGESYEACLRREVREELGVGIDTTDGVYRMWVCTDYLRGHKVLRIATRVTLTSHDFVPSDEMTTTEWVDEAKFMTIDWKFEGERDEMAKIVWSENIRSKNGK